MNTPDRCRYISSKLQRLIRKVSNYCSLLFLMLVFTANSWFIQNASAQDPSGSFALAAPSSEDPENPVPDPAPNEDFVVSVKIVNPENVSVFTMSFEYPDVLEFTASDIEPGERQPGVKQFDINDLTLQDEKMIENRVGRVSRRLVLGINYAMGEPVFFTEGVLFTIEFEASEKGNHQIEIVEDTHLQDAGGTVTELDANELPSIIVPVRGPLQATVNLVPPIGTERVGETGFIDIELHDRSRAHRYEITVNPSANLGPLTVSYNSDDDNGTAITNHTAGDAITISADTWLPNEPLDYIIDWRVTHSDPIVATVFFTPTATGEGSFEITAAEIFDVDNTSSTLSNPDTLTFTIAEARQHVTQPNTGVGPTPIIEVEGGTQDGPFEIKIYFVSENNVGQPINADASIRFPRGVYGFKRDEIEVRGTAGASVTTRLWEADGAQVYYARINPTETGARQVTLQIPADAVYEVGTNLPNVASEIVTVNTHLVNPPWDVTNDGTIQEADAEAVEQALGQGLEENGPNFAYYRNTIENPRTDVNGDLYVNQVDLDLVREKIPDEEVGMRGRSLETRQARGAETPPDASVWMPDAKLRQCVRKALNLADDTDLTQTEMTNLSKLSCRKKGISDITGLEYATNLKSLDILGNDIIDLTALEGLTSLTYLNIKENQISDIAPLGNLTKLTELWMTNNNVEDISPLSNLVELRVLRMSGNPVLDLSPLYLLIRGKLRWYGGLDVPQYPPWDVNEDGSVDATDSALVTAALGQSGDDIADPRTDVNGDGTVDQDDLTLVTDNLDTDGGAPLTVALFTLLDQETLETLDREMLETYLNILRAESDGSSKYQQAIAMLEAFLATLHPKQTRLLANYPNPFNPETWIPYQLASASSVQIIIYDARGTVVRRLDLGHQPEGYYTNRSRAAYWDGRNDFGERVASGIYFYQLQTDNISSLRKLLILK